MCVDQYVCVTSRRTFLLIEQVIGEPLADYIRIARADERTWDWIARDIEKRTGVKYSREWLRRNFGEGAA